MTRTAMQSARTRRPALRLRALAPLAAILSWCVTFCAPAAAQSSKPNVQHTKNTPDLGLRSELKVDPSTLAMSIQIPLGNYPGRGGASVPLALYYNSKVWRIEFNSFVNGPMNNCGGDPNIAVGTECYTTTRARFAEKSVAGWTFSSMPTIEFEDERYDSNGHPIAHPTLGFYIPRMTVRFADGSTHELRRGDAALTGEDPMTGTYFSVDSSRLKYVGVSPGTGALYTPDGSRYDISNYAATRLVDRNGNMLTAQDPLGRQLKDTLGRLLTAPSFHDGWAHTETHSVPGAGGAPMSYTFDVRELDDPDVLEPDTTGGPPPTPRRVGDMTEGGNDVFPDSLFASTPDGRVIGPSTFNPRVLHKIVLPNNTSYTFTYNVYGEIARVVYPTGGYERYRYAQVPPLAHMTEPYTQANRGVVERHVSATGQAADEVTWLYAPGVMTAPDQTRTVRRVHAGYSFGSVVFGFDDPRAGMVYDEAVYAPESEGGAMLRRTLTEWGASGPQPGGHPSAKRDPKILRTVELLLETGEASPLARSTTYHYAQASQPLNVTALTEHEFVEVARATAETGQISDIPAGAPLRTTETTYKDDPAYAARNLVALPVSTTVLAGGPRNGPNPGTVVARTEIYYDEAAYSGTDLSPLACGASEGREASTPAARGNVTTVGRWLDTLGAADSPAAYLDTHTRYDQCGNARRVWDAAARGALSPRVSEVEYSADYQFAYPTQTSSAVPDSTGATGSAAPLLTATTYDFPTGLVLTTKDANEKITSYEYTDPLSRLTRVIPPAGGNEVEYEYGDAPGDLYVKVKKQIDEEVWDERVSYFDGIGRLIKTKSTDSRGDVCSETVYDSVGRVSKTGNPYRPGEEKHWVETTYDSLGRVKEIISPKVADEATAAQITSEYSTGAADGRACLVQVGINQAGERSRSIINALGQLVRFDEPDDAGELGPVSSPARPTHYKYDGLGNLIKVVQGVQARHFLYNSLGRLIRVRQPEQDTNPALAIDDPLTANGQWSTGFTYDANGNVKTTTDAKGVTTSYEYDNLSRVIQRSYSTPQTTNPKKVTSLTPTVSFKYDGRLSPTPSNPQPPVIPSAAGALTETSNGVSTTQLTSFDSLGRVRASRQITDGVEYTFGYQYNLSGVLIEQTYPSGRTVTNAFDSGGDLSAVSSTEPGGAPKLYASEFRYTAGGAVDRIKLGNGRWETYKFNARDQRTQLALGTSPTDTSLWKVNYEYGRLRQDGSVDVAKNDGNVLRQTITVPGAASPYVQTYKYDPLNRLTETVETKGAQQTWKQTYGYDRYGNRTGFSYTVGQETVPLNAVNHPNIDPLTNRFQAGQGYEYDLNGNLIQDAEGRKFVFDADNRQREIKDSNDSTTAVYSYDGGGRRVKKTVLATGEVTVFVYDASGKLAAEYSNALSPNPTTRYITSDILDSPRVITDGAGAVISRKDYMPFGEDLTAGRSSDQKYGFASGIRQDFTGYERDDESQLHFAEARYYNHTHGRFTAVDPLLTSGRSSNPQSFNRYAYAGNNPTLRTDPSGEDWFISYAQKLYRDGTSAKIPVIEWRDRPAPGFTKIRNHILNASSRAGEGLHVLDPFEDRATLVSSREAAQRQFEAYKRQAALNFLAGAAEAGSLVLEWSGALDGTGVERDSEQYRLGQKAGATISGMAAFTGAGLVNAVASRFGKAGLSLLREARITVTGFRVGNQVFKEIAVIGKLPGTLYRVGQKGVEVFRAAGRYNIQENMKWIDGLIERRVVFELASPINEKTLYDEYGRLTAFGQEIQRLQDAGYRQWGNYMVPPPR